MLTHPCPNLNGITADKVRAWISNDIPHKTMDVITCARPYLSLPLEGRCDPRCSSDVGGQPRVAGGPHDTWLPALGDVNHSVDRLSFGAENSTRPITYRVYILRADSFKIDSVLPTYSPVFSQEKKWYSILCPWGCVMWCFVLEFKIWRKILSLSTRPWSHTPTSLLVSRHMICCFNMVSSDMLLKNKIE